MKQSTEGENLVTEYRTNKEAARFFRVSEVTMWRLRNNGLPFHRIRSKILYDQRDLDSFMESQKRNGGGNNER